MLRSLVLTLVLGSVIGCGPKKGGKLVVDTPALPYKAPDIEELSGVSDEPEEPPAEEPKADAAPAPAPAAAAAAPAPTAQPVSTTATKPPTTAPAKAPAKAPATPATPSKKP